MNILFTLTNIPRISLWGVIFHDIATSPKLINFIKKNTQPEILANFINEILDDSDIRLVHVAISHGNPETLKMLKAFGANLNVTNSDGGTLAHLTVENDSKNSIEMLKTLMQLGSNINIADIRGITPLIFSLFTGRQKELIQFFLDNVDVKPHYSFTVAMLKSGIAKGDVLGYISIRDNVEKLISKQLVAGVPEENQIIKVMLHEMPQIIGNKEIENLLVNHPKYRACQSQAPQIGFFGNTTTSSTQNEKKEDLTNSMS